MEESLKILILEDVPEDVGLIERVLKKDGILFSSRQVDSRDDFIEAMTQFCPDVVLSDHGLPQFSSTEALVISKEMCSHAPFILVTGTVSEEFAVMCLKRGADDYVLKSNLSRLPSAIRTSVRHHGMEDEKKKAEDDLHQQNAELIKINSELDSFVYSISHNLRSPLASVLGLLHLAKREMPQAHSLANYFTMMERSVQKLDTTLKEILDYSQNNRNEIVREKIDLEKLVQGCFGDLAYLDGYSQIKKSITVSGEDSFYSDSHRLSVLFHILISNSIQYRNLRSPNQSIRVYATISSSAALVCIEDKGIGIAAELMPRIYEMFYRATERSDGAGLGLYIAKEIMHVLKGEISIESIVNQGTIVTLSIPNAKKVKSEK